MNLYQCQWTSNSAEGSTRLRVLRSPRAAGFRRQEVRGVPGSFEDRCEKPLRHVYVITRHGGIRRYGRGQRSHLTAVAHIFGGIHFGRNGHGGLLNADKTEAVAAHCAQQVIRQVRVGRWSNRALEPHQIDVQRAVAREGKAARGRLVNAWQALLQHPLLFG